MIPGNALEFAALEALGLDGLLFAEFLTGDFAAESPCATCFFDDELLTETAEAASARDSLVVDCAGNSAAELAENAINVVLSSRMILVVRFTL